MGILDNIYSPEDVKRLDESELPDLCQELRQFLIENTAKTGGHLASNLGVVELTVAIHRVFDTSKDRLVFDVGHQSYVHKILTGRREEFHTLRTFGGISGFPKPSESVHDAFVAGHASSAISTAFGMAHARTLLGQDYNVIALVGDGALTGGLSYEGLCDAGDSREPFIVILNDNGMSINKNVGGMASYLSKERMKHGYIAFKNFYRRITKRHALGRRFYRFTHKVKQAVKEAIFHCSMFEDMGFSYVGPVDGHNVKMVTSALKIARDAHGPVVVHVITKKGKGYKFAEENPDAFHGVSGFDPITGKIPETKPGFSAVFGDKLTELAERDKRIMAITAAMPMGTGLRGFAKKFPERFFDVSITEGHAASMAGGAAEQGMIPVFAVYSTFLQRSYDMLIQDISMRSEHVVLAVDRAGLVGDDGETHHGVFDVAYLTSIPNMTVLCPASFAELRDMLEYAVETMNSPVAVRYPRGTEGEYTAGGTRSSAIIREGSDYTIVTYGSMINVALGAAKELCTKGISIEIIKLGTIKPIDFEDIDRSVAKTGHLLVLEECVMSGCVGEKITAHLAEKRIETHSVILKNLGDNFVTHGTISQLRTLCGIDDKSVADAISADLNKN